MLNVLTCRLFQTRLSPWSGYRTVVADNFRLAPWSL